MWHSQDCCIFRFLWTIHKGKRNLSHCVEEVNASVCVHKNSSVSERKHAGEWYSSSQIHSALHKEEKRNSFPGQSADRKSPFTLKWSVTQRAWNIYASHFKHKINVLWTSNISGGSRWIRNLNTHYINFELHVYNLDPPVIFFRFNWILNKASCFDIAEIGVQFLCHFELSGNSDYPYLDYRDPPVLKKFWWDGLHWGVGIFLQDK